MIIIDWFVHLAFIGKLIIVILGLYEVVVRVFPTVADITIVGNIIKVLKWLSDLLNNIKKK